MESVLWVFKSLRDKGLVYRGKRVSLYSTKLNTPISNYEVAMDNSYADVSDPAVTVRFPVASGNQEVGNYERTPDGFVHYAMAVIRNDAGGYLSLYNNKRDGWQFAG